METTTRWAELVAPRSLDDLGIIPTRGLDDHWIVWVDGDPVRFDDEDAAFDWVSRLVDLWRSEAPAPAEAPDVVAAIRACRQVVDDWMAYGTGTIEDRIRLHAVLKDAGGNFGWFNMTRIELAKSIAADIGPEHQVEVDGRVWRTKSIKSERGLDQEAIRSAINRQLTERIPNEDGELVLPDARTVIERAWTFLEPAVGRTGVFRKAGIHLDEFYDEIRYRDDIESRW